MQSNEAKVEILNDLIMINNDRIAGYERAINESKDLDVDLKAMFEGMIKESENYKQELVQKYSESGGHGIEEGTTNSGKIYRAWMDVKATFTGNDRKGILASCEFGEDAWRRAYESALNNEGELDADTRSLIKEQYDSEQKSHDIIKKYRDAHDALDS